MMKELDWDFSMHLITQSSKVGKKGAEVRCDEGQAGPVS